MKQKHLLKSLLLLLALMVGSSAWAEDYTDVLTASLFSATSTTYTDFSGVSVSNGSSAVYAGNNAKTTNGGIQLRSRNSNSGIVSTTSGGNRVKSVSVTVESGTNTLDIYGSNTAYSGASDLYDSSKQGTKVGSLNANGTVTISGDYKYIGLRSNNGALYLTNVTIVWEAGSSVPTCSLPTFTPAAGSYTSAQNVTISTTTEGATIYYTTDGTDPTTSSSIYSSAIPVNKTTTIKAIAAKTGYNNSAVATATYTIVSFEHAGTQNDPYTVADARAAIDVNSGVTDVYATGIVSEIVTEYDTYYENITFDISADGLTTSAQLRAYRCTDENNVDASDVQVGDVVVIKGNLTKYGEIYEFAQGCLLVSLQHPDAPVVPVINAGNVEIACDATSGEIGYTITNPVDGVSLTAIKDANWISNITVYADKVTFTTTANEGNEDRTANITLKYTGAEDKTVTVTQKHYVVDYAELPFEWEGGESADFLALNGVTANGLGSDYAAGNAPYYIKFDGDGDYIQVKTDGQPGKVTVDVKMIGGANTSTITVQESSDGESFNDLEELTISGAQNDIISLETTEDFAEATCYVRLLFTKGSNVGVGAITIAKPETPSTDPVITVDPAEIEVDADEHDGTLALTCENLTITDMNDFDIQYYDAEGNEISEGPDWIDVLVAEQDPSIGEGYVVSYYMFENEGEARTTYFKVYAMDDETNLVYSNLVTITQAAYVAPAEPGNWVLTDLADLTEDDVFVIVGNNGSTYALPNDGGTSDPSAVEVTVAGNTLSGDIAANLQWTLTFDEDVYIFYPNGNDESWLYCTNTNKGVRVGTNDNKYFTIDNGYLKNVATSRYVGIYNSQDWRCYTNTTGNIANQTFSFYKKVSAEEESISIGPAGYRTYCSEYALDFSAVEGLTAYKATISTDNKVSFTEVEQVPAGEGVLLKGAADTYEVPVIASANELEGNAFIGVTKETTIDTDPANGIFVLMNPEDGPGVGFYKTTADHFTLGANTAYLPALGAGARSFIGFDFDNTTTAIEGVATVENNNGEVYNLQGQRVVKAQKGLYIINGKKMVVK